MRQNLGRLGQRLNAEAAETIAPGGRRWKMCAEAGILSLGRYEPGQPADLLTAVAGMEALATETLDNGLLFCLVGQICSSVHPVSTFGDSAQRRRVLEPLCQGELVGAAAATEADAGSDVAAMRTRYRRAGGGYTLDGAKVFVTSAPSAGFFLVLARDGDAPAGQLPRLSYFLVSRDTPGATVGQTYETMGLNSAPLGELVLDGCRLQEDALLGNEGAGGMMFQSILEWERVLLVAAHTGTMGRVLQQTVSHARRRRQFGKPLLQHQQVGARLADARADLEASRLLTYHAAWCKRRGRTAPLEAALAKLFASESYVRASLSALQLHGAMGYATETGIEGQVRDALASTIYGGTSEVLRNLIAAML